MFKIGDYVTRKKYNNDIVFVIKDIKGNNIILCGVDIRLYADSYEDDLVLATISKKKQEYDCIRSLNTSENFYIPGTILHLDSDQGYLDKCLEYYKNQKVKCFGYVYKENEYINVINSLLMKHNPNILVITGHDAYYKKNNVYKNSKNFELCVKEARKIKDDLIIIAGACQSDFKNLIKCGSTFASSPAHINIHALDPAIVASYIALSSKNKIIDLDDLLSKTKYGSNGIGGIETYGVMLIGKPRKEQF